VVSKTKMISILLLLLFTVTTPFVTSTDVSAIYAKNCFHDKIDNEVTCQFNSTRLNLGTAKTIRIVNYNGQQVSCSKVTMRPQRPNVWYGNCDGDAEDANFIRRKDKNGKSRIFGSIVIGSDMCQFGPSLNDVDQISCKPLKDYDEIAKEDEPDDDKDIEYHERTRNLHFGFIAANISDTDATSNYLRKQNPMYHRDLFDNSGSNIDVMVVWTRQAECRASRLAFPCTFTATTESRMRGIIDLAVQQTNSAFLLSGMLSSLRLVHA
jgi:hypothetical protein